MNLQQLNFNDKNDNIHKSQAQEIKWSIKN